MKNTSGIKPVECRVLVLPDPVDEKTKGGIILPPRNQEQQQASAVKGTFIAAGGLAFDDWKTDKEAVQPGDRVLFSKYAGQVTPADDGKEYRLCNDSDIVAVLTQTRKKT